MQSLPVLLESLRGESWRDLVTYDKGVPKGDQEDLDTLESLLPVPPGLSRYNRMAEWLRQARKKGLITGPELAGLRAGIGPNL